MRFCNGVLNSTWNDRQQFPHCVQSMRAKYFRLKLLTRTSMSSGAYCFSHDRNSQFSWSRGPTTLQPTRLKKSHTGLFADCRLILHQYGPWSRRQRFQHNGLMNDRSRSDSRRTEILSWLRGREEEMAAFLAELVAIPTENPPGKHYRTCAKFLERHLRQFGSRRLAVCA